jgi:hypothetical protein
MTKQNEAIEFESLNTHSAIADAAFEFDKNAALSSESKQELKRPLNTVRRTMIVNALKAESPAKRDHWKEIRAEDLETAELSTTLKYILEDYASCADVVNRRSTLSLKNVQASVQMLGGKAYDRVQTKLSRAISQTNPLCEFSAENIPQFKASNSFVSKAPTSELQMNRRPSQDVTVIREKCWDAAIWKASAVRPSSAFERKLKRLNVIGSQNLPQPIPMDDAKEVSRWPTTSSSHHSQFGPKLAGQQTLSMREKSPNASKVAYDVIMPKDRSNLYNQVKDFLLSRLQNLPEDAALSSSAYVAIFFEALGHLSDGLTTLKPLLQAIMSELKSVFDVQNQCKSQTSEFVLWIISLVSQTSKIKKTAYWQLDT